MKFLKPCLFVALFAYAMNSGAALQMKWDASANETKKIYAVTGSNFTINWGDGSSDSNTSHTYTTAGSYTVEISGTVTTLDLRGDDSNTGASGITEFAVTEADNNLATLNIWGNSSLAKIDVTKALGLTSINTTADVITELDLSNNTALTSIDLKLCKSLTTLSLASTYPSLTTVDVNNSAVDVCSLNALFNSLPTASGTIYTVGCSGDATSSPSIATGKGWTFGNGGSGDGSAVCADPLGEVSNVQSSKLGGSDTDFTITWDDASGADSYSVRHISGADSSLCTATYAYSNGNSVNVANVDVDNDYYYVYSIKGNSFVKSGPYKFNATNAGVDAVSQNAGCSVFSVENEVIVSGAESGQKVSLYAVNGMLMAVKVAANGADVRFRAHTGSYLVVVGNATYKVIVVEH